MPLRLHFVLRPVSKHKLWVGKRNNKDYLGPAPIFLPFFFTKKKVELIVTELKQATLSAKTDGLQFLKVMNSKND